jgi:hypothetical protein
MRSLRHVFLALRLRRPDTHGRGGHVHGQRPGSGLLTMLPNSKSPHTGKEPVTGSFRLPPP